MPTLCFLRQSGVQLGLLRSLVPQKETGGEGGERERGEGEGREGENKGRREKEREEWGREGEDRFMHTLITIAYPKQFQNLSFHHIWSKISIQ